MRRKRRTTAFRKTLVSAIALLLIFALAGGAAAQTVIITPQVTYLHRNATGDVVARSNEDGSAAVYQADVRPFSDLRVVLDQVGAPGRFLGQNREKTSGPDGGLVRLGARMYAPYAGRFLTPDPLSIMQFSLTNPQAFNRYSYALNNPYRYHDASGLKPKKWAVEVWDRETAEEVSILPHTDTSNSLMSVQVIDPAKRSSLVNGRLVDNQRNLTTAVDNILSKLPAGDKVRALRLYQHAMALGSGRGIPLLGNGSPLLTAKSVSAHRPALERLKGKLSKDSYVLLGICYAGQQKEMMMEMAKILGVPVFAGTLEDTSLPLTAPYGLQVGDGYIINGPRWDSNRGDTIRCDPGGECQKASRPSK